MGNQFESKHQISQSKYFQATRQRQLNFLATVDGYLENKSEWILVFKNSLKSIKSGWSKSVLKSLKSWENYQDLSSKIAFAWNRYNSLGKASRINSERTCLWRESIVNLQTFSYEIEICPYKRTLHRFLTNQTDCTLSRLIREFQKIITKQYACKENGHIRLRTNSVLDIPGISVEIDRAILQFCEIMMEVIPKFFLDIPETIKDIDSIIRDAIISGDLFNLLLATRKESYPLDNYLETLQHFSSCKFESSLSKVLESDRNAYFSTTIEKLVHLTHCNSLGDMQDTIALLMNSISQCLFDPENPEKIFEDDVIIEAFLVIIIRASAPDLPLYVNIIEKFMDEETMTMKDVGKGVTKLIFLLHEIVLWKDLMPIKNCV